MPPQRYQPGAPPPGPPPWRNESAYRAADMPLLTHDETGAASVARQQGRGHGQGHGPGRGRGPGQQATSVARSGPPPGRPPRPDDGDSPRRRPRRRWLRWTLGVLATVILIPFVAFLIGWLIFPVPDADTAAATQVATFTFDDGTTPVATVRPENINRVKVTLDKVPKPVQNAVLAAEDATFYSNPGFDLSGILRAAYNQITGGIGGGSTITQQYIKITTGENDFSAWRKYKEVVLAVKISREQTKEQILENYLNTIYLGRGSYGVQAAAQAYFGKDIEKLSASEGALLAGVIQSPSRWDPAKSLPDAERRWTFVMDQMVKNRFITAAERAQAAFPETIEPKAAADGVPDDHRFHIYNRAKNELLAKGITDQQLQTEGLTVVTTIKEQDQNDAVDAIKKVSRGQPKNLRYALTSVDPKTGAIIAYYGGPGVGYDFAGTGERQPGSSYKPFVLAAALQAGDGIGLGSTYDGTSPQTIAGQRVGNSEGSTCSNCTVLKAMTDSVNTVFYNMANQIGPRNVIDAAHAAGIPTHLANESRLGIALGDQPVHPLDMAVAYATFADDGVRHDPYLISKVTAADGRVLYEAPEAPDGFQAFSQQVARNVTESMLQVAGAAGRGLSDGRQVASKSGTAELESVPGQNRDAWYVGYTPQVSTSVWVGSEESDAIKNSAGKPIFGRMLPGEIWQSFMNDALRGEDVARFSTFEPMGVPPVTESENNGENGEFDDGEFGDGEFGGGESGDGNGDNGGNGNGDNGNGNGDNGGGDNGNGDDNAAGRSGITAVPVSSAGPASAPAARPAASSGPPPGAARSSPVPPVAADRGSAAPPTR